jgi:hypothetical protein
MDSPLAQEFVDHVSSRGWDIRRMEKPEKAVCYKYIIDEIYKYLRNNGLPGYMQRRYYNWVDLRYNKVRIGTRSGDFSPWFKLDVEISHEIVMVLLYFWSYNERNKRRVKLIGNFHELCQGGKIRKVIPMDLLRYIMEFY